uniref:Titin n=1 Tax=Sphaeramia orbicularis TaxID=375764 RepID=A0A673BTG9_9TELE
MNLEFMLRILLDSVHQAGYLNAMLQETPVIHLVNLKLLLLQERISQLSGISHYIIEKRETSRVTWTGVDSQVEAVSYKVTKLVPGKEYIFRIAAVNKFGVGEFLESEPFIAENPFKTPSAPSTPIVSAVTGDSIVLTWERPESDGGSEIDGYILEKRDKEGVRWTKCNKRRLNDLRFRCTGLTEGHYYQFRISAENAAGVGVVVVKAGDLLRIDADISGRPNPTVSWLKNGRMIGTKGRVEMTITKMHTSLLIRECVRKDSGQYTLTVQNTGGTLSKVVTCKVLDRPGPPAGPLQVSGLSAEKCTLSWGPPLENGGAEIMNYIVEKCETSRVSWTLVYGDMMATTCKVTKLLKGNEYLFRVRAVNIYGEGETLESEPIKAMDPYTVPSAPTDVEVTSRLFSLTL